MKRMIRNSSRVKASEDFVVDYDLNKLDWEEEERKRIVRELADEEDAYDLEHGEGIYSSEDVSSYVFPESIYIEMYPSTHIGYTYHKDYEHEGGGCYYKSEENETPIDRSFVSLYPDGHLTFLWNGVEQPLNREWHVVESSDSVEGSKSVQAAQGKDKKKSSKGDGVRIEVIGEKYERYGSGGSFRKIFKGADLLDALGRMCDGLLLYISSEEIEEDELDVDQILERIEESNGDGCDYIISIRNLTTGDDLLECEYADYDDDYDYED